MKIKFIDEMINRMVERSGLSEEGKLCMRGIIDGLNQIDKLGIYRALSAFPGYLEKLYSFIELLKKSGISNEKAVKDEILKSLYEIDIKHGN